MMGATIWSSETSSAASTVVPRSLVGVFVGVFPSGRRSMPNRRSLTYSAAIGATAGALAFLAFVVGALAGVAAVVFAAGVAAGAGVALVVGAGVALVVAAGVAFVVGARVAAGVTVGVFLGAVTAMPSSAAAGVDFGVGLGVATFGRVIFSRSCSAEVGLFWLGRKSRPKM
jgi:hypothetical protein